MTAPATLTLDAPAKINLHLRIVRRREDGFHEIDTRLAPLALADRLTMTRDPDGTAGGIVFTCDDPTVPGDETNLAVRVLRVLEARTAPLPALRLHLEKRIPHGAGLGGGSSDAAAALRLARALTGAGWPDALLHACAAEVGSDVPFFLSGAVCDATGRGEVVTPVPGFPHRPRVLLIKLPFGVPTPWAYRQWRDSVEVPGLPYQEQALPWGAMVNDLERPVWEKFPILGHLKARLLATSGVQAALMSGSGSTVFAILTENADAAVVLSAVTDEAGGELWSCDTRISPDRREPV